MYMKLKHKKLNLNQTWHAERLMLRAKKDKLIINIVLNPSII